MRVLFSSQSDSLRMFEALRASLHASEGVEQAGFIVADNWSYLGWLKENPEFERAGHFILKEWQITNAPVAQPDLARLADYERRLGAQAGLFGAIVADRRLIMGPDCTYSQDYRRRFSDAELLGILERALLELDAFFDRVRPDVLIGFICVTFLDYLAYLMARSRGVRVLNLRPTRIGDRVTFSSLLNDPDPRFVQQYDRILAGGDSPHQDAARAYIRRVREQHGRYEGVVRPSDRPALKVNATGQSRLKSLLRVAGNYVRYRRSPAVHDNHVPDPLRALLFAALVNPWRARQARRTLAAQFVDAQTLKTQRYAFYPLHTEPEVSLLVYGRPYVNQIEVVRALAMSLPVDMVLVVKEHPWMVGKRSLGAYRKLLDIPKVRLANPSQDARELVLGASLVCVITGSVALEAAMLGKPVVTFGDCPYNALPPAMVRRCDDLRRLHLIIREILAVSAPGDDRALEAYVAAVMQTSESIHLYSVLLAKKGVHMERKTSFAQEIEHLSRYVLEMLRQDPVVPSPALAAAW